MANRVSRNKVGTERAAALVRAAEWFSLGNLLAIGRRGGWSRAFGGAVVAAACAPAMAGPEGAQVVRGQVDITRNGAETLIRAGNNSIINYRSFNIGSGESVRFIQPSSTSRVLNRITTATPTRIDGSLTANGRVYIVNPAGVMFGNGAVVNVAGLYAAGGALSDRDFLAGRNNFTNLTGEVGNQGTITANFAGLIGRQVFNSGQIVAPTGTVVMAAGSEVMVGERTGNIYVKITAPANGVNGVGVDNSGSINAARGNVMMGAGDMYSLAVRTTGSVKAKDIQIGQGKGKVSVSGELSAANQGKGSTGGNVNVLAEQISLINAKIDASGANGGGQVRIGGDFQGKGDLPHAQIVTVDQGSSINVSATQQGNGGTAIVWSDAFTSYYGSAEARGGAKGGNGGLIETSSKEVVDLKPASIDAGASNGKGGSWLIDPRNVTITAAADNRTNSTGTNPVTISPTNGGPASTDSNVDVATIQTSLNGGTSVIITTSQGARSDAGNITVDAAISKTAGGNATLTLQAANNIVVNQSISSTTGQLSLVLTSNDAAQAGEGGGPRTGGVTLNAAIDTNGGSFTSSGVAFTSAAAGTITTGAGSISLNHTGAVSVAGAVTGGSFSSAGTSFANSGTGTITTTGAVGLTHTGAVTVGAGLSGGSIDLDSGVGGISLGANLLTTGGAIRLRDAVTLTTGVNVDTTSTAPAGANITFDSSINGTTAATENLTLNAGTGGNIVITGATGGGTRLGQLTITDANDVTTGALTLHSMVQTTGAGTTTTGSINTSAAGVVVSGNNFTFGTVTTGSGGALDVTNTGLLTLAGGSLDGGLIQSGGGTVSIGGNVSTTNDNISIAGDLAITGAATLDAGTAIIAFGGDAAMGSNAVILNADAINFGGGADSVSGTGALTLRPSTNGASISVGGAGGTLELDSTDLAALADGFSQINIGRATTGAHTITISATTFKDPVVFHAAGSGGSVGVNGTLTGTGNSSITINSNGAVALNSDIVTAGGAIQINGSAILGGDILLDSTNGGAVAAGANIGVTGTVDGTTDSSEALTLRAGTAGDITLGGAVGASTRLDGFTITSSNDISAAGVRATSITQTASTGNAVYSGALNTTGASGVSLTGSVLSLAGVTTTGTGGLAIVNSGALTLGGAMVLDGAFSQTGAGAVTLSNNLSTTSDTISFASNVTLGTDLTVSSATGGGADITFSGTVNGTTAANDNLTVAAGTGDVAFTGNIGNSTRIGVLTISSADDVSAAAVNASAIVQTTGTGLTNFTGAVDTSASGVAITTDDVTFGSTVNSAGGLTIVNTGALTLNGNATLATSFIQSGGGTVALNGNITATNGVISVVNNTTVGANNLEFNSGSQAMAFGGSLTLGTNNITLTGNEISFSGGANSVTGSGALVLQSGVNGTTINVGAGADAGASTLDLTSADLAALANGFSSITIGRATGTQAMNISAATFNDPVTFRSPGGGTISVNGTLTGAGNATITINGASAVSLGANIVTAGNAISIGAPVTVAANSLLDTTNGGAVAAGANITVSGAINGTSAGGQNLTLRAGTGGDISLASVGATTRLGAFAITSADDVTGTTLAATTISQAAGGGTTTFSGALNTSAAGGISLTGNNFSVAGATTTGTGVFTVNNSGTLTISSALTLDGAFSQTGIGATQLNAGLTTTNDAISFAGNVTVGAAIGGLNAGTAGLTFGGSLALGANPFTLTGNALAFNGGANSVTGTGALTIQGAAAGTNIGIGVALGGGALDISSASWLALADGFSQITVGRSNGTGTIGIGAVSFRDSVLIQSPSGQINVSGTITGTGDASISLGGDVAFAGGTSIITDNQAIDIDGDVVLTAGSTTLTTSGAGSLGNDITISGTVTAPSANTSDLALNAGTTGDVTLGGNAGTSALPLLSLTVTSANDVSTQDVFAATITQNAALGTSSFGFLRGGAGGIDLTGNVITLTEGAATLLGGTMAVTNSGTLTVSDGIALDGSFVQSGGGAVALNDNLTTTNDDISFADAITAGGTFNALSAGTGVITLGDTLALGALNTTLTANDINFGGGANSVSGTGNITLQPGAAGVSIGIAGGAGTFSLGTAEFNALADGFNQITVGRADGTHTININAVTFRDAVVIRTPNGGTITTAGDILGSGDASVSLASQGAITLGGNIRTAGNAISLTGPIVLGSAVVLDSTNSGAVAAGADINLTGDVQGTSAGAQAFTLTAGTGGDINLAGSMGTTVRLGALSVTSGDLLYSADTIIRSTGATIAEAITGTEDFTLDAGAGAVTLNGDLGAGTGAVSVSGLSVTQNGSVTGGSYAVVATNAVTINDDITASGAGGVLLSSGNSGTGNLTFGSGVNIASGAMTLSAGNSTGTAVVDLITNTPTFTGAAGGSTSPTFFQFRQDGDIAGANLAATSQFGNGISGMDYRINSRNGAVTIDVASKVNGSNLRLTSTDGISILTNLTLAALRNTSAVEYSANVTTTNGGITNDGTTRTLNDVLLNAGSGVITFTGAVNVDGTSLTLVARDLDIGAAFTPSANATLAIQTSDSTKDIYLGGTGTEGTGDMHLTSAEISRLGDGFADINIGRSDSSGTIWVKSAVTFQDPLTLSTPGSAGSQHGAVRVEALLQGTGDASITIDGSGATTTLTADIRTQGQAITINDKVVVGANVALNTTDGGFTTGGDITITDTIDADAAAQNRQLTLNSGTAGFVTIEDAGITQRLGTLTAIGDQVVLKSVQTTQSQTYTGTVTLDGDLNSSVAGPININGNLIITSDATIASAGNVATDDVRITGTVNTNGTSHSLTLNAGAGNVGVGGAIGGTDALANLFVTSAGTDIVSATTTGSQTYTGPTSISGDISGTIILFNDALTLNTSSSITGTNSVTLDDVLSQSGENNDLAVNSPTTVFNGDLGGTAGSELGILTTDAGGTLTIRSSQIRAVGLQNYGDAVLLGSNVTISGNAAITFGSTINSTGGARNLAVNTAGNSVTTFGGAIGATNALGNIATNSDGTVVFNGSVNTTGAQTFNDAAILNNHVTFNGVGITFGSTIDSDATPRNLVFVGNGGAVSVAGAIGGTSAISSLTSTSSTLALHDVTSVGSQTISGDLTLDGDLHSTSAGTIDITGKLLVAGDSTITSAGASGNNITLTGAVDSTGGSHSLAIDAGAANVNFINNIGATTQLSSLSVEGSNISAHQVATTGAQTYTGNLSIDQNLTSSSAGNITITGNLTLGADVTLSTTAGDIVYGGTVNGNQNLVSTANGGGTSIFNGIVGGTNRLTTLVTNGKARFNTSSVATTGDQTFNGALVVGADTTIEAQDITFNGAIDSDSIGTPHVLTVNSASSGETRFFGTVGGAAPLLRINTNADGITKIGTSMKTTDGMTFADPVKLTANSTIDGGTGSLFFRAAIDADSSTTDPLLTLLSSATADGDTTPFKFGANIGSARRLGGLTLGADRSAPIGATAVFSDGFQANGTILASSFQGTDNFTVTTGAGGFTMGRGQKLTAFGSINILTTGTAKLGDLTALTNIKVTANAIQIQLRGGAPVLDNVIESGTDVRGSDGGVDFVASGNIDFSVVPTTIGSGSAPTFSNNLGQADPQLLTFGFRQFTNGVNIGLFTDSRAGHTGELMQIELKGEGPSITNTATTLAGAIPRDTETRQVATPVTVGKALRDPLQEMGVATKDLSVDDLVEFMVGRSMYRDLPLKARPTIASGDFQVTVNRLSMATVEAAVDSYRKLVFIEAVDENGNKQVGADGRNVFVNRTETIRDTLGEAWDNYSNQATDADGAGFRAYLEGRATSGTKAEQEALQYLKDTGEVLQRLDALGLSPFETSIPKRKLLGEIKPPAMTDEQMQVAVNGATLSRR